MNMNLSKLKQLIEERKVVAIDLKYADLIGNWYHITFPPRRLDHVLKHGIPFDGSSIPGMKSVESGDMVLLPDPTTAIVDPFFSHRFEKRGNDSLFRFGYDVVIQPSDWRVRSHSTSVWPSVSIKGSFIILCDG